MQTGDLDLCSIERAIAAAEHRRAWMADVACELRERGFGRGSGRSSLFGHDGRPETPPKTNRKAGSYCRARSPVLTVNACESRAPCPAPYVSPTGLFQRIQLIPRPQFSG